GLLTGLRMLAFYEWSSGVADLNAVFTDLVTCISVTMSSERSTSFRPCKVLYLSPSCPFKQPCRLRPTVPVNRTVLVFRPHHVHSKAIVMVSILAMSVPRPIVLV